jgi:ubiquinone/menaquinone biosynthesis C-methylase UbiE
MQRDPDKAEPRLIRSCLRPVQGNVLEVGCGDGRLTGDLAVVGDHVIALDSWVSGLVELQKTCDASIHSIAAMGESLPLKKNRLDRVIFTLSLHHLNPRQALKEAQRVLTPGGRILILEPCADTLVTRLFAVIHDESDRYALARTAIEQCEMKIRRSGSVATRWVFEDFREMVDYLFDYFDLMVDTAQEEEMAALLGLRRSERPLSLEDVTRFWLLR